METEKQFFELVTITPEFDFNQLEDETYYDIEWQDGEKTWWKGKSIKSCGTRNEIKSIYLPHTEEKKGSEEVKYGGLWTPEYLANRLLFPKPVPMDVAQILLKSWAHDIVSENFYSVSPPSSQVKEETIKEAAHEYFKRGQFGFEKAADTEMAFLRGALFVKNFKQ